MLERLLGIKAPETIVDWGLRLRFGGHLWLLGIAAATALAAMLYWRESMLGRAARWTVAVCRVLALSLLVVMLFGPVIHLDISAPLRSNVLVLVDESASMDIRDTRKDAESLAEAAMATGRIPFDPLGQSRPPELSDQLKAEMGLIARRELVEGALRGAGSRYFQQLADQATVNYFRFARDAAPVLGPSNSAAVAREQDASWAEATHLGSAIQSAVDRFAGQPLSGVVLLTDGASNGGADPLSVAQGLAQRGIPLFPIGVGLARPDDAALCNLVVPNVVFANDVAPLRVECVAYGYERRSTTLLVTLDGNEVARKVVTFSGKSQWEEIEFKTGRTAGTRQLEVSLAPLPGEATVENNVLRQSLRVLDDKIKVLCIEGTPRWEYRYLRAVLKRDPRIEARFITTEGDPELARASREHLGRFPEKEEQAFAYDLIVVGDVRAAAFTPTQLALIERLVREQGGSLILLAGPKHAPAEYLDTPLAAMLPVRFQQERWEEVGDDVYPALTSEGRQTSVMMLEKSEAKTQALWANLKPLYRVPPLLGAKPGARVLAELSDSPHRAAPLPLIAWQRYGTGKVMFIGTDQLWRLRARAGDKYHLKFWGQAIQFLTLSRLLGESRLVRLETSRTQAAVGEPIEIVAHVTNAKREPSAASSFNVQVWPPGQGTPAKPLALKPLPGSPGTFSSLYTPTMPGRHRITGGEDQADAGATEFEAMAPHMEQLQAAMQRELLQKLAETSGGRYLDLKDLPALPAAIGQPTVNRLVSKEIELWQHWLVPLVFVGLTALEWTLRRRNNLA